MRCNAELPRVWFGTSLAHDFWNNIFFMEQYGTRKSITKKKRPITKAFSHCIVAYFSGAEGLEPSTSGFGV
jgi:hypothetical protein